MKTEKKISYLIIFKYCLTVVSVDWWRFLRPLFHLWWPLYAGAQQPQSRNHWKRAPTTTTAAAESRSSQVCNLIHEKMQRITLQLLKQETHTQIIIIFRQARTNCFSTFEVIQHTNKLNSRMEMLLSADAAGTHNLKKCV